MRARQVIIDQLVIKPSDGRYPLNSTEVTSLKLYTCTFMPEATTTAPAEETTTSGGESCIS